MRFDINETVLRHIATSGGCAYQLRKDTKNGLPPLVAELFEARSDVRRLVRAAQLRISHDKSPVIISGRRKTLESKLPGYEALVTIV